MVEDRQTLMEAVAKTRGARTIRHANREGRTNPIVTIAVVEAEILLVSLTYGIN